MDELYILLENFWIIRESDSELYYRIKDQEATMRPFLEDKLGYRMIVNPHIIKVDKIPDRPESWMGIQAFQTPLDYSFFMLVLDFLEDKGPEEQFILSQLTEYIQSMYPSSERDIDWTLYQNRRALVRVLQYAREMELIHINDGDEAQFAVSEDTEVLYENTGISRYFMRVFPTDITYCQSAEDILKSAWLDKNGDRGIIRRNRVYRRLVLSPAIYSTSEDEELFLYIKNYRNTIQKDMEDYLDADMFLYRSWAMVLFPNSGHIREGFPNAKNLSDITLSMAHILREWVDDGKVTPEESDVIVMTYADFYSLVAECIDRYSKGWYKSYREKSVDKLAPELMEFMYSWRMLDLDEERKIVYILPLIGQMAGVYPKDFIKEEDDL